MDSVDDLYEEKLLEFASAHGPLFGLAGLRENEPVIEEPVAEWKAAQHVMDRILQIDVCVERSEIAYGAIRDYFPIDILSGPGGLNWEFGFTPGVRPQALYLSCLSDDFINSYTTNDGSVLMADWKAGKEQGNGRLGATFATVYPRDAFSLKAFRQTQQLRGSRLTRSPTKKIS